ncbi:MAG: SGNH/GDSL hydrolase family protein [Planctomycetaceae bacterium]|nr:SGNH/GDSL hydrolase family protein [Planctomycetaceae bacterium]
MIGDSLTNASQYPNEVARLLSLPGNPEWEMLGTHRPGAAASGVMHEGYGGWTWARFNSLYAADENGIRVHCVDEKHQRSKSGSSPFVFPNEQGKPELNLSKYFEQYCNGNRPDFITIKLGINDCFSAPYKDPAALDARIDSMFKQADILIAALRKSAPYAEIGICLTTPGNSRDEAFDANYKGRYTRQGWNKIQHRLVQRQIKYFSAINDSKISIIPTELYLDITDGYPSNNAVHPNKEGYQQIGSSIYAWLKWRLASSN